MDPQGEPSTNRLRRHRRLLVAILAACLLVALATLLLVPTRPERNSVQVNFDGVLTNYEMVAIARFALTNTTDRAVELWNFRPVLKEGELRFTSSFWGVTNNILKAHQSCTLYFTVPQESREWRARLIWMVLPTRVQSWRAALRRKAAVVIPIPKFQRWATASNVSWRTNYSADFPR